MTDRDVRVRLRADISDFQRKFMQASAGAKMFVKDLESADSRIAGIVQGILAIAPAAAPIGAAAVPAIAGLVTQLGLAVAAAGATAFAFDGVGGALDALNKYKLEPTAENLAKVRQEMDTLAPSGQEFVFFLESLGPELQDLQRATQDGLFPGVQTGLEELLALKPQAEGLLATLGKSVGDLVAEAGDNLNDPRWVEFFEFLEREAGPTLEAMGKTLGNFVEGIANMVMSFNPLADDFTGGMLDMSRSFREWTEGLDSSKGFQDFVDYVRESGPLAMDALGSIALALVALVKAAAPVGQAVLPIISALADAFAAVVDSPVGPVLVATAAAVGVLGRSLALLRAVGLRGDGGSSIFASVFDTGKMKAGATALLTVTSAQDRARLSTVKLAEAEEKRAATVRAGLAQAAKMTAVAGGIAVATTGVADSMGLANTATYAMLGTLGGPWGAALGAGIGLVQDFSSANDDFEASLRRVDDALAQGPAGLSAASSMISESQRQIQDLRAQLDEPVSVGGFLDSLNPAYWSEVAQHFGDFSNMYQDEIDAINAKNDKIQEAKQALWNLGMALGQGQQVGSNALSDWGIEDLAEVADRAAPAMDALGYSLDELGAMDPEGLSVAVDRIQAWVANSETAQGRNRNLAASFGDLENEMIPTAAAAESLAAALDSILGPQLGVSAANDAWVMSLRNLRDELSENGRALKGNSTAALENREQIRGRVEDFRNLLVAEAEAGAGSGKLSRMLRNQRQALIETGVAAGLNRAELREYLTTLGLTPRMVKTILDADPKPAEDAIGRTKKGLNDVDRTRPNPKIGADAGGLFSVITSVQRALAGINDKTVHITSIYTTLGRPPGNIREPSARGNLFFGRGDVMNGHQPVLARGGVTRVWNEPETGGEAYIPLRNDGRRPRAKGILEETAGLMGGEVHWFYSGGNTGGAATWSRGRRGGGGIKDADDQAKSFARRLKEAQRELEKETEQRRNLVDNMKSFRSDVAGSFSNDPFGNGLAGFDLQVEADENDARAMERALRRAKKKGLDGGLFAALAGSGDLTTAQQLAGLTRRQIHEREQAFGSANRARGDLGQMAANTQFGKQINAQNRIINKLEKTVDRLEKRLPKAVEDGARRGVGDQNRRTSQRSKAGR